MERRRALGCWRRLIRSSTAWRPCCRYGAKNSSWFECTRHCRPAWKNPNTGYRAACYDAHSPSMSCLEEKFSLKNKVAVVLGGTSGIGQAIARGLARAGAATIASSRDKERVAAQAAEIESLGVKTLRITSDVQDRASLQSLCDETVLVFGQVDILVVTSGALKKMPTVD